MWVNYAKNHTGFVIGFTAQAPFFGEDDRTLRKVQYIPRPRVLPVPDVCACFYKSSQWKYEREWRCVRMFQSSEFRLVPVDPALITEIVIGHKMESRTKAKLAFNLALNGMEHVEFFLSTPSHTLWEFGRKPIALSLCDCCAGEGYTIADRR
jgi:hypothetical protein